MGKGEGMNDGYMGPVVLLGVLGDIPHVSEFVYVLCACMFVHIHMRYMKAHYYVHEWFRINLNGILFLMFMVTSSNDRFLLQVHLPTRSKSSPRSSLC